MNRARTASGRPAPRVWMLAAMAAPLAMTVASAGCQGCLAAETEETEAPEPAPTPTPTPTTQVEPEVDAGEEADAGDAADAGKPKGVFDPAGIRRCCDAIDQNAKSAPPNLIAAYAAASATCRGIKASPQAGQQIAALAVILKGAGLPPACR